MKRFNPIILGVVIVIAVVVGAISSASFYSGESPVAQYKISDSAKPQLQIKQTNFEFGTMRLSDVKTQELQINNTGTKPLAIYEAITSCDCTFVQFIIKGVESQKFSMRPDSSWRGEIAPQSTATVRLIYQPSIMPVKGQVKRQIVFKTNDPTQSLVTLTFNAIVE